MKKLPIYILFIFLCLIISACSPKEISPVRFTRDPSAEDPCPLDIDNSLIQKIWADEELPNTIIWSYTIHRNESCLVEIVAHSIDINAHAIDSSWEKSISFYFSHVEEKWIVQDSTPSD